MAVGSSVGDRLIGTRPPGIESGAGTPPGIVLRVAGLSKRYGDIQAVRDVSFTVRAGEVYGFLGPNGSGKSTTIAMLLGLVAPTAGTIELFGRGPAGRAEALARVGAIIEAPSFYPYLSGFDNLSVLGALRGGITTARIREVLALVDLAGAADRRFGQYSLGMKQRLGIAWTLIHDPDLIILDEPTNGLDPAGMVEVRALIRRLADGGTTVFLSSHLLNEVEQVCDRVAILKHGAVLAEGRVVDLIDRRPRAVVQVDRAGEALRLLAALPGVERVTQSDDGDLIVEGEVAPERVADTLVRAGHALYELRRERISLEHVFLDLTGSMDDTDGEAHHG
ncbi:MAG TPA: ABC transporter ATP-binding protein [Thermomicrobiaceae bacterium]|nr:ABC transporter ATP-binding protein [Thermomicrobiaceae bacterium]